MNPSAFAQPQSAPPPGQSAIGIDNIIGIYVGIASISTPPSEDRAKILTKLEQVIYGFVSSLNFGVAN